MDGEYVDTRTIHTSENYLFRLKQLLRAAGYDAALLKNDDPRIEDEEMQRTKKEYLEKALGELSEFIAQSDLFYPEDIASEFIEWHAKKVGKPSGEARGGVDVDAVIADIVKAGFFNDSGVESYAAPCTPMALGLTEIAVQAQANHADTRFVLGSTDICNLKGLNKMIPDRRITAPFLAHMIHKPREAIEAWAADHGYSVETMIVRAGGDEFKYIHRFKTRDGSAIDGAAFDAQIATLQKDVMEQNREFARINGVAGLAHHKVTAAEKRRSPGVLNTMAMCALAPEKPDIQHQMVELGADIALIREIMDANPSPVEEKSPDMYELPTHMPRSHHKLASVDIYAGSPITAKADESLEHLYLRQALAKAGFLDLAVLDDLFVYKSAKRWSDLNDEHPAFMALDAETQKQVRRLTDAEHMRGVIDPVSRNYSLAFRHKCEERAMEQNRRKRVLVHFHNLSGMNLVDDTFGDAVLRKVGNVIDHAYETIAMNGIAIQKPLVVRNGGGEFLVFLDTEMNEDVAYAFSEAIKEGTAKLNQTPIIEFAKKHRIEETTLAAFFKKHNITDSTKQEAYTIGRIPYPIEPSFGMNRGLSVETTGKILNPKKARGGRDERPNTWQKVLAEQGSGRVDASRPLP